MPIKINRKTVNCPVSLDLDRKNSAARNERARHLRQIRKGEADFDFKAYAYKPVKKAVFDLSKGRCGYCGLCLVGSSIRVEHYRPKAALHQKNISIITPGYYWLAYNWNNLLPSCENCNNAKHQNIYNYKTEKIERNVICGKGNFFPVKTQHKKNLEEGCENSEEPLLFNSCTDNASDLFEIKFLDNKDMVVILPNRRSSIDLKRKAEVSIDLLGLNRIELCRYRYKVFDNLERLCNQIIDSINTAKPPGVISYDLKSFISYLTYDSENSFIELIIKYSYPALLDITNLLFKSNHRKLKFQGCVKKLNQYIASNPPTKPRLRNLNQP